MLARAVFALLMLAALPARAEEGWTLPKLMAALASVPAAEATFTEERHLQVLTMVMRLEGTLSYTAPARLEKHVILPEEERLLIDGDRVSIETPKDGNRRTMRVDDYPALSAFVAALRATMAGDQAGLQKYYRTALDGSEAQWRLSLTPLDDQVRQAISGVLIGGAANRVTRIEIQETNGDRSVIAIQPKS